MSFPFLVGLLYLALRRWRIWSERCDSRDIVERFKMLFVLELRAALSTVLMLAVFLSPEIGCFGLLCFSTGRPSLLSGYRGARAVN